MTGFLVEQVVLELRVMVASPGGRSLEVPGPVGWTFFPWTGAQGGVRLIPVDPSVDLSQLIQSHELTPRAYPRVATRSDKDVVLELSDKFPVLSFDPRAGQFQTNYCAVGVNLTLKPSVKADRFIELAVHAEVKGMELLSGQYAVPTSRATDLRLRLRDGQTVLLEGLITEDDIQAAGRVPFLAELPHVRRLFGRPPGHRISVSLTPHIMR